MDERTQARALLAFAGGTLHTALFAGFVILITYRGGGVQSLLSNLSPVVGVAAFLVFWAGLIGATALGLGQLHWPPIESAPEAWPIVGTAALIGGGVAVVIAASIAGPFGLIAFPVGLIVGAALGLIDAVILRLVEAVDPPPRLGDSDRAALHGQVR